MKVVKILNCKNSLLLGLLFVVTLFPILMVITNAHAELLTLKNGNNSSAFENANNKTSITTTTNASSIEKNLDNKTISQQVEFLKQKQIDVVEVGNNDNNNSSSSSENATQTKEFAQTETYSSSLSKGNVTMEVETDSEFQSPAVSFVENEGEHLTDIDYQNKYGGFSSDREHEENESSRDRDRDSDREDEEYESSRDDDDRKFDREDDEGKELLEGDSDYNDYLLMLRMMKENAELNKERENRVTEEIPSDNSELDKETREDEEEKEFDKERLKRNMYEGRLERYLEPNNEQTINYNNKLLSDSLSSEKINDQQRYGAPIDNENKKLLSQFTKVDSSPVIPDLQAQTEKSKPTIKDSKIVANAGLDQSLRDETRIVLDASSSFSSDGNITNFLWKQLGDVEEKIKPSNSRIYSFPIPEDVDDNTLEFELTVMDKNGQKASDTVKILLADEQYQVDNNSDVEEESENEQPQIQAVDEVNNQDDNEIEEEEEEEEEEEDDNEEEEEEEEE